MSRRHNPLRAQLHRNYTIAEITELFDVCKTTVSHWIHDGLPTVNRKRPLLVTGTALRAFHAARVAASKRPCQPGELYCTACKRSVRPVGDSAILKAVSATSSDLVGTCRTCNRRNYRRVALVNLARDCAGLALKFEDRDGTCNAKH